MYSTSFHIAAVAATAALLCGQSFAQTYTTCNPLVTTGCKGNTALGTAINVDFTKGSVNSFTSSGSPVYDDKGVSLTVAKSGDAPQLESLFYIMFGKVAITMKCAPGAGIVSTLVLQSDDLDEIDMEWLGADDTEVQTNYFGKGDVTTYNRGQFNPAANNQAEFITYTIEWTEEQITWSVGNDVVRVLTPATADANQYPQTPMQVKFGAWAGGDTALNPPGTVGWARGPTDFSAGPFTMLVQSLAVTDYSTGTSYSYGDQSGSWKSITAAGGSVNGNIKAAGAAVASADVPAATGASPSIPAGLGSDSATKTGWPWVATATPVSTAAPVSTAGIPEGWVITASGKVVPASAAVVPKGLFTTSWPQLRSSFSVSDSVSATDVTSLECTPLPTPVCLLGVPTAISPTSLKHVEVVNSPASFCEHHPIARRTHSSCSTAAVRDCDAKYSWEICSTECSCHGSNTTEPSQQSLSSASLPIGTKPAAIPTIHGAAATSRPVSLLGLVIAGFVGGILGLV